MSDDYRRRLRARERLRAVRAFVEDRRRRPLAILHAPAPPARDTVEAPFMALAIDFLRECGWQVHHETDSRRTPSGFPDLLAVRPPRVLVVELKRETSRLREEQGWWADDLARCPGIEYLLLRPSDWPRFVALVAPPGQRPTVGRDVVEAIEPADPAADRPAPPAALDDLRRRAHG